MKLIVLLFGLFASSLVSAQDDHGSYGNSYYESPTGRPTIGNSVATTNSLAPQSVVSSRGSPDASSAKVHEIHTTPEREVIRVEEYKRPRQVIRIHEAPAPPPEIIRVQAPPEPQKVIRVLQRARPTRVQFTQTAPEVQLVNIPIRQVQPVVQPVVQRVVQPVVQRVVQPSIAVAPAIQTPIFQRPVALTPVFSRSLAVAAPISSVSVAPLTTRVETFSATPVRAPAPPAISYSTPISYSSGPAVSYVSAPGLSYATVPSSRLTYGSYASGPVVSYGSGYSNGYGASYTGQYKKSSAKKA